VNATSASLLSLGCFLFAIACVVYAVRDIEFLNVLDDGYEPVEPPNVGMLIMAFGFLIAFVVFGVIALFESGLT
jgi:hypothetical protein